MENRINNAYLSLFLFFLLFGRALGKDTLDLILEIHQALSSSSQLFEIKKKNNKMELVGRFVRRERAQQALVPYLGGYFVVGFNWLMEKKRFSSDQIYLLLLFESSASGFMEDGDPVPLRGSSPLSSGSSLSFFFPFFFSPFFISLRN